MRDQPFLNRNIKSGEAVVLSCSVKKGVLRNLAKFARVSFLIKLQAYGQPFSYRTPPVAASELAPLNLFGRP